MTNGRVTRPVTGCSEQVSTVVAEDKVGKEVVEGAKEAVGKVEEAVDVVIVKTEEVTKEVGDKVDEVVETIKRRTTGRSLRAPDPRLS